jgi:hypothetical protein
MKYFRSVMKTTLWSLVGFAVGCGAGSVDGAVRCGD